MARRSSSKKTSRKSKSTESAEGLVKVVTKKFINARGKKKPVFSFCLEDNDGDESWYRTGFNEPDCEKGDTITFDFEETEYGLEVVDGSIEVIEEADEEDDEEEEEEKPKKRKKATTKRSGSAATGRDAYWERKEQRDLDNDAIITYAAARNAAINLVTKLVELDVLDIGKTKNKKLGVVEAAVDKYTDQFFAAASDVDNLRSKLTNAATEQNDDDEDAHDLFFKAIEIDDDED